MNQPNRILAFLSYLGLILGALYVLLFHRRDEFAVFHARQSLGIVLAAVIIPLGWAALSWLATWVPLVGPILAVTAFGLVIAAYAALVVAWVAGMVFALQAKRRSVPIFGSWASWLPLG